MSVLERLIRDSIASGASSEDIAKEFTKILSTIKREKEKEKTEAKEKAEREELIKKIAAEEKAAKEKFYSGLRREFDIHWNEPENIMTARDVALIAIMVAMKDPANKNWTKENIARFVEDMTATIARKVEAYKWELSRERTPVIVSVFSKVDRDGESSAGVRQKETKSDTSGDSSFKTLNRAIDCAFDNKWMEDADSGSWLGELYW